MATWTTTPDIDSEDRPFEILRAPATGNIKGTIISEIAIWTKIHFWHGRSKPCSGIECEACEGSSVPRWKGYLQFWHGRMKCCKILEVTARIKPDLDAYYHDRTTLRGARVTIRRTKAKANGPLQIDFEEGNFDASDLPKAVEISAMLDRMWESGNDRSSENETDSEFSEKASEAGSSRVEAETNGFHRGGY